MVKCVCIYICTSMSRREKENTQSDVWSHHETTRIGVIHGMDSQVIVIVICVTKKEHEVFKRTKRYPTNHHHPKHRHSVATRCSPGARCCPKVMCQML
jgi:hypothetical protein